MAVPWVRFTENALVPKIMLQFQNGDTFQHQGDSAGIFMYSAGIFETFVKKILCPRASPMCSAVWSQFWKVFPVPRFCFQECEVSGQGIQNAVRIPIGREFMLL